MLRFEAWPPEPDKTFITDATKQEIGDWMESIHTRIITQIQIPGYIADLLHSNSSEGRLSSEQGRAFYEALAPQIPETRDGVGESIRVTLKQMLTGEPRQLK